MYDFLFEEAFWMETIIAALITGGMTIIGVWITAKFTYNSKMDEIKNGQDSLARDNKDLSKEHSNLSNEHSNLSNENEKLSKEHYELKQLLSKNLEISNALFSDKKVEEIRMENLDDKCKNIINDIKELNELPKIITKLVEENARLRERIKILEKSQNLEKTFEKEDFEL